MNSKDLAKTIRRLALEMVTRAKASHIGSALSIADIVAVLYADVLNYDAANPKWDARDRLILSKGHACTAIYAALAATGFFPVEELASYGADGSRLMSHISHKVPGVEFSTGSLGHGLPFGVGKALAAKRLNKSWRTFVILSDGELNEGSNWEAILFAPHHKLDNLVAIVDYNKIQSLGDVEDILSLNNLSKKFEAFNWEVEELDGHDHGALKAALTAKRETGRPLVIIANTVKGKGVTFMENQLLWHYRNPNAEQLKAAVAEIESAS